jgi:peptide-methionine (R)-S-oxide reductase
MNPNRSAAGFDLTAPTLDQRTSLEADLTLEESDVLLRHGTEAAFCGGLLDEHREGVFTCRLCGLPLFLAVGSYSPWRFSVSRRSSVSVPASRLSPRPGSAS